MKVNDDDDLQVAVVVEMNVILPGFNEAETRIKRRRRRRRQLKRQRRLIQIFIVQASETSNIKFFNLNLRFKIFWFRSSAYYEQKLISLNLNLATFKEAALLAVIIRFEVSWS